MILTLINFTKEAYKHDMPYFQRYLDEYAELNFWRVKKEKRTDMYENDDDAYVKPTAYSKKSTWRYDKYGFDDEWYNREWYDAYWYNREWFNRKWYNEEWFDKFGFDKDWYNYKGFDKNWYDREWYDKRWFDKNWYDKDWYDEYGEKKILPKKSAKISKKTKK